MDDHMIPVAACADEEELDEFNRKPPEPESAEPGNMREQLGACKFSFASHFDDTSIPSCSKMRKLIT